MDDKPSTPISKSITSSRGGSGCSGVAGFPMKPMIKGPSLGEQCFPRCLLFLFLFFRSHKTRLTDVLLILQHNICITWQVVRIYRLWQKNRFSQL